MDIHYIHYPYGALPKRMQPDTNEPLVVAESLSTSLNSAHFPLKILANFKPYKSSKSTPSRSCLDAFESDLWNRYILQLSLLEPNLYYAATALVGNGACSNCLLRSKGVCCNVQGRVAARPSRQAGKQVAVGGAGFGRVGINQGRCTVEEADPRRVVGRNRAE